MVDKRYDPVEAREIHNAKLTIYIDRYCSGQDSVHVFRANLHCLNYRGDDLEHFVRRYGK